MPPTELSRVTHNRRCRAKVSQCAACCQRRLSIYKHMLPCSMLYLRVMSCPVQFLLTKWSLSPFDNATLASYIAYTTGPSDALQPRAIDFCRSLATLVATKVSANLVIDMACDAPQAPELTHSRPYLVSIRNLLRKLAVNGASGAKASQ